MSERKILVVDDDPQIVRFVGKQLRESLPEYALLNAPNGQIGYQLAVEKQPTVIVMDWDMPVLNGLEATKKIFQNPLTEHIPIIMSSGMMVSVENLQEALNAGATDYIRKPVDPIELIARVNTAIRIYDQRERIKDLLQAEVDFKTRKLSTTTLLLSEKGTLLWEIHEKLDKLFEAERLKQVDTVKGIVKDIELQVDAEKLWEDFKMHFEEVHPNFFQNLMELDDTISQKDLRLCAYVKMNLDSKAIANLMNISANSVNKAVYRLKKKLGRPEEEAFRLFVHTIG